MRSLVAPLAAVLVLLTAGPALAEPLPVGSPPVAVDDAVDVRQNVGVVDQLVHALANDTDPDGDPLGYTAVGAAGKGTAYVQDGRLFYRPPWRAGAPTPSRTRSPTAGATPPRER